MREFERRVQTMGLTWPKVAGELGVDRTTLAHIRAGRDRLSLGLLHQIAVWFPNDPAIQRLAWDYLLFEVETARDKQERGRTATATGTAMLDQLDPPAAEHVRRIVADFARLTMRGSSVLLVGADATVLGAAINYLNAEFESRSISAVRERADAAVGGRHVQALLGPAALLVERLEYASESMVALLAQRMALGKVVIATCLDRDRLDALGDDAQRVARFCATIALGGAAPPAEPC